MRRCLKLWKAEGILDESIKHSFAPAVCWHRAHSPRFSTQRTPGLSVCVMKYSDKLKDPRWQKMRLEVFSRAGFACEHCFADSKTLHAHHNYYVSGREPWEYPLASISCLCSNCHDIATSNCGMEESGLGENEFVYPEWESSACLALECERESISRNDCESVSEAIEIAAQSSGWPKTEAVNLLARLAHRHACDGGLLNKIRALEIGGVL